VVSNPKILAKLKLPARGRKKLARLLSKKLRARNLVRGYSGEKGSGGAEERRGMRSVIVSIRIQW
jgi:hypothetical protein